MEEKGAKASEKKSGCADQKPVRQFDLPTEEGADILCPNMAVVLKTVLKSHFGR